MTQKINNMHQQRKLPSKRYSSYMPPTDFSTLEDHVSSIPSKPRIGSENDVANFGKNCCKNTMQKSSHRKTVNTLHFDALQSAVSKLSRIDDYHMEELGYGFFSDVFKVTHKQSGKIMVLKRNKSTNTKLNILREVQLMNRLAHPNILKFMGVCVHEGQLHALTEFINGGDLDQLVQNKNTYLSWSVRIRLALDISKGLSYLHSMGIFHRDLTAKNCLVRVTTNIKQKKTYSAVVADLGLAEKIPTKPEEQAKLRVVGTPYCMAPEVLRDKPYDEKSDFFSFGLIICQLIIRTSSDPEKLPRSNDFGLNREVFSILVKKGYGAPEEITGKSPLSMPPNAFMQLAYDCCEVVPTKRPNVKEIVCRLEQISNEEKLKRKQEKETLLKDAQAVGKRHSLVLTDLSSITNMVQNRRHSKGDVNKQSSPRKLSLFAGNLCRSSGSGLHSRLSRSSSDVSSELISHAASIIASSQKLFSTDETNEEMSSVVQSLNEAFINPFNDLENSELQEPKIYDLPSSEVLEMTFDLPTPRLSTGSPKHSRHTPVQKRRRSAAPRPRSLLLEVGPNELLPSPMCIPMAPRVLTPEPVCDMPHLTNLYDDVDAGSNSSSTLDATNSTSPVHLLHPHDTHDGVQGRCRLKQARIRSIAFSPQGQKLISWWHSHSRAADPRSLTSVLSIMTEKMGVLQRSISVPDLSRDPSSLFVLSHKSAMSGSSSRSSISSEKGSPRSSVCGKPPSGAKIPPNAYPAYVTLPRKKKSRLRSGEVHRKHRSKTSDNIFQDASLLGILHEETADTKQPAYIDSANDSSTEINNNETLKLSGETKDGMVIDGNQACSCEVEKIAECTLNEELSCSSNSSGLSSTGLKMSIQTGVVSSNRRKKTVDQPKVVSINNDSNDLTKPEDIAIPLRNNRDSGYNDDVFSTDHSCDSQSSQELAISGSEPHPYTTPTDNPYLGKITPTCKIKDSTDCVKLIGKSH